VILQSEHDTLKLVVKIATQDHLKSCQTVLDSHAAYRRQIGGAVKQVENMATEILKTMEKANALADDLSFYLSSAES
jgi:uncharacterized protein YoxC